jgi:competence protein ComEC
MRFSNLFFLIPSFILGITLANFFHFSLMWFLPFIFFLAPISLLNKNLFFIFLIFLFFFLGFWYCQNFYFKLEKGEIFSFFREDERVVVFGKINSLVEKGEKFQKFKIKPESIENKEKRILKIKEEILVFKFSPLPLHYGDRVKIVGKLKKAKEGLKKEKISTYITPTEVEILERGKGNFFLSKIFEFREKLIQKISSKFLSPKREILSALLVGEKSSLPSIVKEKLNISGLRHITAVSGMHLVLVSNILMSFLLSFGFWRKTSLFLMLFFILFFTCFWGFQVSVLRASLMASVAIISQYFHRMQNPTRTLLFCAFLLLLQNPLLIGYDISFQLSFLATAGILYLSPLFDKIYLSKILPSFLFSPLKMTISAQIFTLPILAFNFKTISLVSPLTNLLVLPFLPLLMIFGFCFLLIPFDLLSSFFAKLSDIFLSFLIFVVDYFSKLKFASLFVENFPLWFFFLYYFLLVLFLLYWQRKEKGEFLN